MKKIKAFLASAKVIAMALFVAVVFLPSNTSAQTVPNPIAWWDFSDGSSVTQGTIIDKMGSYNAVNFGGAERGAKWISNGYEGGAINFNCSGSGGTVTDCFMRRTSLPAASNYTLLFRMQVGDLSAITGSRSIFQSYNEHANICGGLCNAAEANKITTAYGVSWLVDSDNAWHHYAFVWGNSGHYYYKDGIQIGYADGNFENVKAYEMNIGASTINGPDIQLDEIKVYGQALTASQIAEEYNNNKLLPPVCTSWTYSDWSTCTNSQQTRTVVSSSPDSCTGGSPVLTQSCTPIPAQNPPKITSVTPATVNSQGTEVEIIGENFGNDKISYNGRLYDLDGGTLQQIISWSNTRIKATITLKEWNKTTNAASLYMRILCLDERGCVSFNGNGANMGEDIVSNTYSIKVSQPSTTITPTTPPITPQTTCTEDTWTCNDWNSCSANGIQTRSCRRTFDCTSVETAPPETSQICFASVQPNTQSNFETQESLPLNQTIISATVKLVCFNDELPIGQGSGTVIDPRGIILTNQHVVNGSNWCAVGLINDISDDPAYSDVAFPVVISSRIEAALLLIDNPNNKSYNWIDIEKGDVKTLKPGSKIRALGYPAKFGTNLTYTEGVLSGFGSKTDGTADFIKTTTIFEYGNSGGGAYDNNGTFIGIPTRVLPGELNSIGLILKVNSILIWINSVLIDKNNISSQPSDIEAISTPILSNLKEQEINIGPDLSEAFVKIYGNKAKTQLLPNSPGIKQTKSTPTFIINGVTNGKIAGYYVYFGSNINADPVKKGKLTKKATYSPPTITKKGVYYFIFKVKDKAGKISNPYITEYRYKK